MNTRGPFTRVLLVLLVLCPLTLCRCPLYKIIVAALYYFEVVESFTVVEGIFRRDYVLRQSHI